MGLRLQTWCSPYAAEEKEFQDILTFSEECTLMDHDGQQTISYSQLLLLEVFYTCLVPRVTLGFLNLLYEVKDNYQVLQVNNKLEVNKFCSASLSLSLYFITNNFLNERKLKYCNFSKCCQFHFLFFFFAFI